MSYRLGMQVYWKSTPSDCWVTLTVSVKLSFFLWNHWENTCPRHQSIFFRPVWLPAKFSLIVVQWLGIEALLKDCYWSISYLRLGALQSGKRWFQFSRLLRRTGIGPRRVGLSWCVGPSKRREIRWTEDAWKQKKEFKLYKFALACDLENQIS